jgi:hypothetical protein
MVLLDMSLDANKVEGTIGVLFLMILRNKESLIDMMYVFQMLPIKRCEKKLF